MSTHRQTVSTPLASNVLTASWDSHLVSRHRWTVSTPLLKMKENQLDRMKKLKTLIKFRFTQICHSGVDTVHLCVDTG
ncbi:hypothetical protein Taro_021207 [Colocasia esculenta]|uniref:Uncharacterized protein n=1 Tax=Colocasia esculenta TaxID=4460 RepID=A0A843UYE0_COLES|nr:hypothetical protein [Colocasia esculenta]